MTQGPRPTLRVATYNIHRCRGIDGRTRPERIASVLRAVDADVVALQEVVGAGPRGGGHAEAIGASLGMGWVMSCLTVVTFSSDSSQSGVPLEKLS